MKKLLLLVILLAFAVTGTADAAGKMEDLDSGLEADVLVCCDDRSATDVVIGLLEPIDGLRGLDAGSLSQAAAIEAFTAVAITLNIRYKTHSTIKMAGL